MTMATDRTNEAKPTWEVYCRTCKSTVSTGTGEPPTAVNTQEAAVSGHLAVPGTHDLTVRQRGRRVTE